MRLEATIIRVSTFHFRKICLLLHVSNKFKINPIDITLIV